MSKFDIHQTGYFGVSLLDVGTYGAHLIDNRTIQAKATGLFFNEAEAYYHHDERALTIEGLAKSPIFAIQALDRCAKIAREMDELSQPFAS